MSVLRPKLGNPKPLVEAKSGETATTDSEAKSEKTVTTGFEAKSEKTVSMVLRSNH
jgi:hypothetical protein